MTSIPLAMALALGIPVAAVGLYVRARGYGGSREDIAAVDDSTQLDGEAALLADSIGWPYVYGRGTPATPWSEGPRGVDCSGYAQMCLVRLGRLSSSATDRGASSLAYGCDPVAVGDQTPGDLAYYPGHVVVVASYPDALTGHSAVLSASGDAQDLVAGLNPNARVKLYTSALYRGDFLTYMRLK
jgi:cell wall-associated NlpC family hydrolase